MPCNETGQYTFEHMSHFILMAGMALLSVGLLVSCDKDEDPDVLVTAPTQYEFLRDGVNTISFSGQTSRIDMATELVGAMQDFSTSEQQLLEMFANQAADGSDVDPYADADLNASSKSIKSKVAASKDLFSSNASEAATIRSDFESWLIAQVTEVAPRSMELAEPGKAGQIADGSSVRYVSGKGLEYNQAVNKALIGALMTDQILNNYLGAAVLDEADNRTLNDAGTPAEGKSYTTMEHKWDEAYGYLFGGTQNAADPLPSLGGDDIFLNTYLSRVEGDTDFSGIAADIFDAFKLGRAAIVAGDYTIRDAQATKIRTLISQVIAVRSVYYLQQGKNALPADGSDYGSAFHDLSEGFGFVYSLRFTRKADRTESYFSKTEVGGFIEKLSAGNGFWEIEPATLDEISEAIAAKFDFTVAQASE